MEEGIHTHFEPLEYRCECDNWTCTYLRGTQHCGGAYVLIESKQMLTDFRNENENDWHIRAARTISKLEYDATDIARKENIAPCGQYYPEWDELVATKK